MRNTIETIPTKESNPSEKEPQIRRDAAFTFRLSGIHGRNEDGVRRQGLHSTSALRSLGELSKLKANGKHENHERRNGNA